MAKYKVEFYGWEMEAQGYSLSDEQVINILSGYGIESDIKQKQEEVLPLGESVIPEAQPSLVVG